MGGSRGDIFIDFIDYKEVYDLEGALFWGGGGIINFCKAYKVGLNWYGLFG